MGVAARRAASATFGNRVVAVAGRTGTPRVSGVRTRRPTGVELGLPRNLRLGLGGSFGICRRAFRLGSRLGHEQQEER